MIPFGGEWRGGVSPPRSLRTGREPLGSSGSRYAAVGMIVQRRHRAVLDAIESGNGDESEAAMLVILEQTSKDVAIQTKASVGGRASFRSHKRFQNGME